MQVSGSLPVIPTPLYEGHIDYSSLEKLFDYIFPELDGYTLCGSTGEAASLSLKERVDLVRFAAQHTPAGKQIVVGLGNTNVGEAITLARVCSELGVAGGLVPAPYYYPNTFPMVVEYLRAIERASDLPLIFYDNPVYTKTWLRGTDLVALAKACPHLQGVKLTDHDLSKIPYLRENNIPVFCGDDIVAFRSLLLGVSGSMIIAPSIFPESYQEVVRRVMVGDTTAALELFARQIQPFIHLFGPGDEIPVTKAVFCELDIFRSGEVRPPLLACSSERLRHVMLAFELNALATPQTTKA